VRQLDIASVKLNSATRSAAGSSIRCASRGIAGGSASGGNPPGIGPTTAPPFAARPTAALAAIAAMHTIRTPGQRGAILRKNTSSASAATPNAAVSATSCGWVAAMRAARSNQPRSCGAGKPSSGGTCDTMMISAAALMNPAITG
jgi:hypothetical protein